MGSTRVELKPLLRGWIHAVATVAAIPLLIGLVARTAHDPARMVSMLVYGLGTIQLYAVSAVYHLGSWRGRWRARLRALDHANIFLMIAATYTPIGFTVLSGPLRVAVLLLIWALALTGMALTVSLLRRSRWLQTALYTGMGSIGVLLVGDLLNVLPLPAVGLIVAGGVLYISGAVVYALRWPDPIPHVFGFHEIFHVLVFGAGAAFATTIWVWVVPFS